ncbi:3',5'-cyclic AMP phosphodiesterase CpdA [Mesorhizobium sp. J18]|uniref:metallophosphoesterase family protein n=1 Tax=Mesorhizobium sp. J18 TaxID=935263 RepID=UPI00119C751D|nr:metallophosphoesterase [Mesorhizobium sp. J18]TWG97142.1 3',5'-cyclic AMP phosphodiesterase CpdA [Mesorhizobium sp. J18]
MFRLAHFSDIHLGPLPRISYRQLISKRITGYINWHRRRRIKLDNGIIDRLTDDMVAAAPDHIALTGDLVNLALDSEIEMARLWLEGLGEPDRISVVPGNHDAYVPGALDKACRAWGPWMRGDGHNGPIDRHSFPYMRVRGPVALIGISSARATAPFLASGYFQEEQAERTAAFLKEAGERSLFRVIMIHHPPIRGATSPHKRLLGISRFKKMLKAYGAELVLHGHTHLATVHWLDGLEGSVPVVGVAAAGQSHGSRKPAGHYNLFEIVGAPGAWQVRLTRRGSNGKSPEICELSSQLLVSGDRIPA